MPEIYLVIRCSGQRKRDVLAVLANVSDYADEQFEEFTMTHGRPMSQMSWTEPADQRDKLHMVLAEVMEWWNDLPNDTRGLLDDDGKTIPSCIKQVRKLIPERDK